MLMVLFKDRFLILICFFLFCLPNMAQEESINQVIERGLNRAESQSLILAKKLENREGVLPRTYENDRLQTVFYDHWVSGFFPGILWLLYENSQNIQFREYAELYTARVEPAKKMKNTHDLGFMLYCSFGQGYRLTKNPHYLNVIKEGSENLLTRWNPKLGVIKSWERKQWQYPVIIDNMMNLELLFWAARNGGGQYLYDIACKHAETTMKHQFRKDYSCYHVAVYDTLDGHFIKGVTHQGLSDDSMWARGQAWAIYGYTMVYRETHDVRFLDFARKVSDVYLSRLPEDMIPYWDFNAPELSSGEPKDASASAITASALLELSTYINDSDSAFFYRNKAVEMLQILSSPAYQARNKKDAFLLHSVGHMNKGWEVDASISYADYYYLEALVRLKRLKEKQSVLANL